MSINAQELTRIKTQLDKAREDQIKAEADLDNYINQLSELDAQIRDLGYDPDKLHESIEGIMRDLDTYYAKLKAMLGELNG